MTEEGTQFEARIEWPQDTFAGAEVANFIVLSDDGQGVYLAFGHIPPFPARPPEDVPTVVPNVRAAVYLTYKNTAELGQIVNQFFERKQREQQGGPT